MSTSAKVASSCKSSGAWYRRRSTPISTKAPVAATMRAASSTAAQKPVAGASHTATYMPSM